MSIHVPAKDWFRAPSGFERVWIGLALVWCLVMFLAMPYWHFSGKQNSTGEAYSVSPAGAVLFAREVPVRHRQEHHQAPDQGEPDPDALEAARIGLALVWCLVMFLAMPYWHFSGKQNSTGEAYSVSPADFSARVDRFVADHRVRDEQGIPVVAPPPGSDVYLLARMWSYYPILELRRGQTYRVHISSMDLQHGFSLQPTNMNFQILPGYDHVLTLTPTESGTFQLICNEFCGIGHHQMTGRIIVED